MVSGHLLVLKATCKQTDLTSINHSPIPTASPSAVPRPSMERMIKKASKGARAKLRKKQEKSKTPMVRHTISKASGKQQVPLVYIDRYIVICQALHCGWWEENGGKNDFSVQIDGLRTGAAGLKVSQVYPPNYGTAMARFHKKFRVLISVD